jgi:methyl-accepting chemotaxis protein
LSLLPSAAFSVPQLLDFVLVHAEEVRNLAQRCAAAAKETAIKIEDSVAKSQQGSAISADVAKSFATIQEQIRTLDSLVTEIAVASTEQSEGIAQVNIAVAEVDKVTQSNAAVAEESAAAVVELNREAESLTKTVGRLLSLIGGRREKDPLGRAGAPKRDGRRPIDRTLQTPSLPSPSPAPAPAPAAQPSTRRSDATPVRSTAQGSAAANDEFFK